MIKLISSDMDGTLLDSYRQITPINVEAIKRAQENGINFIVVADIITPFYVVRRRKLWQRLLELT